MIEKLYIYIYIKKVLIQITSAYVIFGFLDALLEHLFLRTPSLAAFALGFFTVSICPRLRIGSSNNNTLYNKCKQTFPRLINKFKLH